MGTCDPCLDGRHTRCKRSGCSCNICHPPPKAKPAKVRAKPKAKKPPKPRPAGTDNGSTKPLTKAEEDALCEGVLKLCQALRMRQIKDTAAYELRRELREMAVARADKMADEMLGA